MPGYDRPEGGWQYVYEGLNTIDAPDAMDPTMYPYGSNIRISGRHVRTRPGYVLFATTVRITTSCPITIATELVAYTFTFTATGGATPYTWSLLSGSFPTGLSLSSSGVLSGTPTSSGYFTFTVKVVDSRGSIDTLSCSLFVIRDCATDGNWSGCMSGAFTNAADWTYFSGNNSNTGINGDGRAYVIGVGGMRKSGNTCGDAQDQEVYLVYNTKTSLAGGRGYRYAGPACRLQGTSIGNCSGYLFTAQFWGGTTHNAFCGDENFIILQIEKYSVGVLSLLATNAVFGPDLAEEIPMIIRAVQESGQARVIATLGSTEVINVLDPTPLSAGAMGFGCTLSCTGNAPTVYFDYIKGRNL